MSSLDNESARRGRQLLKAGARKIVRDCYRYKGETYWIVEGRCLTREQAERLEDERRREGRTRRD